VVNRGAYAVVFFEVDGVGGVGKTQSVFLAGLSTNFATSFGSS
jgi:hypothetical protein